MASIAIMAAEPPHDHHDANYTDLPPATTSPAIGDAMSPPKRRRLRSFSADEAAHVQSSNTNAGFAPAPTMSIENTNNPSDQEEPLKSQYPASEQWQLPKNAPRRDEGTASSFGTAARPPKRKRSPARRSSTEEHTLVAKEAIAEQSSQDDTHLRAQPLSQTKPRKSRITFDEYLSLSEITFEWGDSYDVKDWPRLRAILAPTLKVDYTQVNGHRWDEMPAEEFIGIMSHLGFVGDPLVHTQHHIGASKWEKISDDEVTGYHQLRAAHQRYTAADMKVVENKGHGHAVVTHYYKRIDGEWKFAGLKPNVRWNEFEFEKIFKGF